MDKPQTSPRSVTHSPDDVDGLLRAFFRTEMPPSWPAPATPTTVPNEAPASGWAVASPRRAFSLMRSRWALAASVLALLLGHAVLSRTFPDVPPADAKPGTTTLIGRHPGSPPKPPTKDRSENHPLAPK